MKRLYSILFLILCFFSFYYKDLFLGKEPKTLAPPPKVNLSNLYVIKEGLKNEYVLNKDRQAAYELVDINLQILKINPNDKEALLDLGKIAFDFKLFIEAKKYFGKLIELEPKNTDIISKYASCLIFLDKNKKAIDMLEKALVLSPNHFPSLSYLAIAHYQSNNLKLAKSFIEKALSFSPDKEGKEKLKILLEKINEGLTTG